MANVASAKKYIRVSAKKRALNDHWRSTIDNLRRKFVKAIAAKDGNTAKSLLVNIQTAIDKAAQRNVLHKNTAARVKSRLTASLKTIAS